MEEYIIDQLLYTRSDIGLGNMSVGYRVRAASPGLQNIRGERYRSVDRYLRYQLPPDINPNSLSPQDAPICLSFIDIGTERLLVRKVYKGRDFQRRPGLYFTHLLAGLPRAVTAREAILLWHAPNLWITDQDQLDPSQLALPQLSANYVDKQQQLAWNTFDLDHLEAAFGFVLVPFLRPSPLGRLYLSGSPESIATIIWGITQSLPRPLLRDMMFSTYESDPTSSEETIIGLFSERYVPSLSLGDVSINVDAISEPLPARVEESARRYIDFAVQTLKKRHLQKSTDDALYKFISLAEQQSINDPAQLLALFQRGLPKTPPITKPPQPRVSFNPPQVSADYPPLKPPTLVSPRDVPSPPRVRRLLTSHRGTRLSLLLNAVLFLFLLALLIFLPLDQNNVRQEAVNNVFTKLTQTANASKIVQAKIQATRAAATATAQARGGHGNEVGSILTSPQTSVKNGQTITLYIAIQNTGQNTWSSPPYNLICVNPQDLDCKQAKFSTLKDQSVPPGGFYIFTITINAHFAAPPTPDKIPHTIMVQLAQGSKPFGDAITLSWLVKS